jgi:hypothetical protein
MSNYNVFIHDHNTLFNFEQIPSLPNLQQEINKKLNLTSDKYCLVPKEHYWRKISSNETDLVLIFIPHPGQSKPYHTTIPNHSSFTILQHFLSQHESKSHYFIKDHTYVEKLQYDINTLVNTFQESNELHNRLLKQLMTRLYILMKGQPSSSSSDVYHKWVIELSALNTLLSDSTLNQQLTDLLRLAINELIN